MLRGSTCLVRTPHVHAKHDRPPEGLGNERRPPLGRAVAQ